MNLKKTTALLCYCTLLFSSTNETYTQELQEFSNYSTEQKKDFKAYKQEFEEYKKAQNREYKNYKKTLSSYWEEAKLSSKKEFVSYSKDNKTRTVVDYAKNEIVIQVLDASQKSAKEKMQLALAKIATMDTQSFYKQDPLQQKLSHIKRPKSVKTSSVGVMPILSNLLFQTNLTKKRVYDYVTQHTQNRNIKSVKSTKLKNSEKYTLRIKLPKNAKDTLSKNYFSMIKEVAQKEKVPVSLILAIMETESNFNPFARSHIPAYGLMQIVPRSAGIDAYNYLYKSKRMVSGSYLYNANNNIKMGGAYIHILYYNYLRKIKNPQSRMYCTIAAYNTGAGNIAWAFTRKYNINRAATKINAMTPTQVYNRLKSSLRYSEARHYLKNVYKKMLHYNKLYEL